MAPLPAFHSLLWRAEDELEPLSPDEAREAAMVQALDPQDPHTLEVVAAGIAATASQRPADHALNAMRDERDRALARAIRAEALLEARRAFDERVAAIHRTMVQA